MANHSSWEYRKHSYKKEIRYNIHRKFCKHMYPCREKYEIINCTYCAGTGLLINLTPDRQKKTKCRVDLRCPLPGIVTCDSPIAKDDFDRPINLTSSDMC